MRVPMKYLYLSFIFLAELIILGGCAPKPIIYHSEASLPYFDRSTKTNFELIKNDNSTHVFEFGVISAKDNDTLSYVLLAPANTGRAHVDDLVDANLSYSIPLLPKQVKEFVKILNSSSEKWSNKYSNMDGISYEFSVAPEHLIVQKSENVFTWYSTLKFYFQNNEKGPMGTLIFGEGLLQYLYRIKNLSDVTDLTNLLNKAMNNK